VIHSSDGSARVLWEKEVAEVRASASSLPPAARQAVRAVLEAILSEAGTESEAVRSTRSLLFALEPVPAPTSRTEVSDHARRSTRHAGGEHRAASARTTHADQPSLG